MCYLTIFAHGFVPEHAVSFITRSAKSIGQYDEEGNDHPYKKHQHYAASSREDTSTLL
jgi:hypothetical protein